MATKHHKFALLSYNPCHKITKLQIQKFFIKNAFSVKIEL